MEKERRHRGGGGRKAQTFRRGRAITFYQQLEVKRDTLRRQLEDSTMAAIHTVIIGELKATEAIMDEFKTLFALDEVMEAEQDDNEA